jgi:hypothetical protein
VIGAKPIEIYNNNLVDPTNPSKLLKDLTENEDY